MAENSALSLFISSVRLSPVPFSRQNLSMMCSASSLCACARAESQLPDSVLIIPFLQCFLFFLIVLFLSFVYFIISSSNFCFFFLYLPFSNSKEAT